MGMIGIIQVNSDSSYDQSDSIINTIISILLSVDKYIDDEDKTSSYYESSDDDKCSDSQCIEIKNIIDKNKSIYSYKLVELQNLCRENDLSIYGTKDKLIKRLYDNKIFTND